LIDGLSAYTYPSEPLMYTVPSGPILGELYPKLAEFFKLNDPTWLPVGDNTQRLPYASPIFLQV
jgi:hypothetical protein